MLFQASPENKLEDDTRKITFKIDCLDYSEHLQSLGFFFRTKP